MNTIDTISVLKTVLALRALAPTVAPSEDDIRGRIRETIMQGEAGEVCEGEGWFAVVERRRGQDHVIRASVSSDAVMAYMESRLVLVKGSDKDLYVGPRHPRANTGFEGDRMIANKFVWDALEGNPGFSFEDARGSGGTCIVFGREAEAGRVAEMKGI